MHDIKMIRDNPAAFEADQMIMVLMPVFVDMLKSAAIMIISSLVVGGLLNLVLP